MSLELIGEVQLPAHDGPGGFGHAAVHSRRGRLYVAHTANNAVDVIDCATHTYRGSISGLEVVAGALVFPVGCGAGAGCACRCSRCDLLQPRTTASLRSYRRARGDRGVRRRQDTAIGNDSNGDECPYSRVRPEPAQCLRLSSGHASGPDVGGPRLAGTDSKSELIRHIRSQSADRGSDVQAECPQTKRRSF